MNRRRNASEDSAADIGAAMTARGRLLEWGVGAELLTLVDACARAGWLTHLSATAGTTVAELAAEVGTTPERVSDVLGVLLSAGVIAREEQNYVLGDDFAALLADASGVGLDTVVAAAELQRSRITSVVTGEDRPLSGVQALTLAEAWGLRPTAGSRELYRAVYEHLQPLEERLRAGGRFLDAGCGVGGNLLAVVGLFPGVQGVGLEIVPEVADEARRRAQAAGFDERVEIRTLDARQLDEDSVYTGAYWAQEFFDDQSRDIVFAALLRALEPGGFLVLQELFPASDDREITPRAALDKLFFRSLRARYGATAEELAAEAVAAGFRHESTVPTPAGRLVLARRPV